jgi:outer membrane protein TolC
VAQSSILESLVSELERNNPELKATRREVDMRVARIAPAGAPPDPSLSFGYMGGVLRPPFFPSASTPDGFRGFGISQELPFPGKLALRSSVAATEADAARWNSDDVRVRLIAELKRGYFDYVLADRSLEIVGRNKQLLEQVREIAESQFRVGKAPQQDVLKAQLEISMLLERASMLQQDRATAQAALNGLLYRAPDTPVEMQTSFDAAPLPGDVQQFRALALDRYPGLRRDEQQIQRGQQGLQLARKEILPDFAVNLAAQQMVGGMPWMYGVDVMVTVPLFWQRKQRPMIAEAQAALDAGRRMRENTLAQTQSMVTQAYVMASTAERLLQLYSDSILPQARLTLESSIAAYQVGSADFLTLLMNFTSVLANELSYEQQQAQYRHALAQLEPFVGMTLIR